MTTFLGVRTRGDSEGHLASEVADGRYGVEVGHDVVTSRNCSASAEILQDQHDAAVHGGQTRVRHPWSLLSIESQNK